MSSNVVKMTRTQLTAMVVGGMIGAGTAFARMYFMPGKPNALPSVIRLQPAW